MTVGVGSFGLAVSSFILETFLTKNRQSPKIKMGADDWTFICGTGAAKHSTTSKDDKPSPSI